jgi:hypothetical protein
MFKNYHTTAQRTESSAKAFSQGSFSMNSYKENHFTPESRNTA